MTSARRAILLEGSVLQKIIGFPVVNGSRKRALSAFFYFM